MSRAVFSETAFLCCRVKLTKPKTNFYEGISTMVADAFGDNAFSRRLRIDGREGRGKIFARFHLPDSRKQRQFHQLYQGARPQRLPQARGRRRTRDGVCSGRCRIRQLSPGKIRNDGRRSGPRRGACAARGLPHDPVRLHSRGFSLFLDGLFRRRNGHRRRCVLQVQDLRASRHRGIYRSAQPAEGEDLLA